MKRALVLRATCAIIGTAFTVLACSSSNPTLPPGVTPLDAGPSERGIARPSDATPSTTEAGVLDAGAGDARNAADTRDAPLTGDGGAVDVAPPSKVTVTIVDPVAAVAVDGGAASPTVVAKSDRLAPTVRVEVQSMGGDPTLDVVISAKATVTAANANSPSGTINLNQTDYSVVPESGSKIYIYADMPFDLSGVAGDFYDLQVTATTAGGVVGTASVRIYIDGGPIITLLQPAEGAYVKGSVVVTAMVVDNRAGITGVAFSIGQYEISPSAVDTNGAQYSTTIDFGSFNPPLDGGQIVTITATNGNGNTSIATRKFTIDNTGPAISSTKPGTGDLIGKIISIEANVEDPAGVMKDSVMAVVAHGDVHFEVNLVQGTDGVYRQIFDTTKLPSWTLFPSISFRAQDVLGNESSMGYLVSLDNTPPILDLDPPANFQLIRKDGICSWPMDPVGPDAIDDGAVVTQLFDIRARIEDQGNTPLTGSTDFVPIAAVDPATVKLLILGNTSLPLVVDTSDPPDGICDDINPDLVPSVSPQSSKDAQLIDMVSLPANSGAGDFTPQPGVACSGQDGSPPASLCDTTYSLAKNQVVTYWPGYAVNLLLPSIWTIAPIVDDGLRCAGNQFDASNNLKDGWACVAVEASDKMGNKQVSRPIRICVVGQPGSTACAAATSGGADIAGVTLPSDVSAAVVVTTKTAVLAVGSTAIKTGDQLIFSKVGPTPFSEINGTHAVSPADGSGTRFNITNLSERPIVLYLDNLDGKAPVRKGTVGLIGLDGAVVSVVTDTPDTVLDPSFSGKVVLMQGTDVPKPLDDRWAVQDIQPTGFNLTGSTIVFTGMAIPPANLPDCTGTVVKQTSGSKVDATKPCKPWASYPKYEQLYLK
jgi:hypothetical protein